MTSAPLPGRSYQVTVIALVAVSLVLVLHYHLLAALFAGLLVFELVFVLVPVFRLERLAGKRARLLAVGLLTAIVFGLLSVIVFWSVTFLRGGVDNLPLLLRMLAEVVEGSRSLLPEVLSERLPADMEQLKHAGALWLREHSGAIQLFGAETLRTLAHILVGMAVGAMLSLREALDREARPRPLTAAFAERVVRFCTAFRRVVFAQVRISLLNSALTYLYICIALPLLGVDLPYANTLIMLTFLAGLLPVVGNLVSNTVITLVSLSISWQIALASLAFLVLIHKGEYFLNAHIIGSRVHAAAWELLIAMLVMEAIFGLRGLIAAPVYYAYLKDELSALEWI